MKNLFLYLGLTCIFANPAFAGDTPHGLAGVKIINATEVKELMAAGVPLYDVRVVSEYAEEHIKGATSLPYKEKSKKDIDYDAAQDGFDDTKLPAAKMIFYCNAGECWKSYKASKWAVAKGKKEVYWFRTGIPEWKKLKFDVVK